jgi:hypothetical protein
MLHARKLQNFQFGTFLGSEESTEEGTRGCKRTSNGGLEANQLIVIAAMGHNGHKGKIKSYGSQGVR